MTKTSGTKKDIMLDNDNKAAALTNGRMFLFAIGIDTYPDKPLSNCRLDAEAFVAVMQERYGFLEANTIQLYDTDASEKAIKSAFIRLGHEITPADSIVIYYSGHGWYDKIRKRGYWVPANTSHQSREDFISNGRIKEWIEDIQSHHTLLIADSCFAGSFFIGKGEDKSVGNRIEADPSRWGIASGRLEVVDDGIAGEHSPFSRELLTFLKEQGDEFSLSRMGNMVMERVAGLYSDGQTPMFEPLRVEGHRGGQMYFRPVSTIDPDEADWLRACDENSITAYMAYCHRHAEGKHILTAIERIEHLEDDEYWEDCKHTRSGLQKYLLKHPERKPGRHTAEALQARDAFLKADAEKQIAAAEQEQQRLAMEKERQRLEAAAQEQQRLAAAEKEQQRLAAEQNEKQRLAAEKERHRLAAADKEQQRLAAEQKEKKQRFEAKFGSVLPKMIKVEEGSFLMNAPNYHVTLDSYYIAEVPVTQKLWQAIMGKNPSGFIGSDNPVECVSWFDVQRFIEKLNEETGQTYRLPTEAEWEYAARGGKNSKGYEYSGSNNIDEVAWYDRNSGLKTHPVGLKQPNELGIYDMSGNVWEWCNDWYGTYPSAAQNNPKGPSSGGYRVLRGGSCFYGAGHCRAANRSYRTPVYRNHLIGFRLALSSFPV